jgi:hypothetical protein
MAEPADDRPDNAEEIAKARRWLWHARLWQLFLLVMMGIPPLICCININNSYTEMGFVISMFGLFAPMVAFGALLLTWRWAGRGARRLFRGLEADELGHHFSAAPEMERANQLRHFHLVGMAPLFEASSRVSGLTQSGKFVMYDLFADTVIVLPGSVEGVPGVEVTPLGILGALGLTRSPIRVRGEDAFNRAFALVSRDFQEAPQYITPELAELCVKDGGVAFEARQGDLLVFWPNQFLPAGQFDQRLSVAVEIARLLRAARP